MFNTLVKQVLCEMPMQQISKLSDIANMPQRNVKGLPNSYMLRTEPTSVSRPYKVYNTEVVGIKLINSRKFLQQVNEISAKVPFKFHIVWDDLEGGINYQIRNQIIYKNVQPQDGVITIVVDFRDGEPLSKWMVCHIIAHHLNSEEHRDANFNLLLKLARHIKKYTTNQKELKLMNSLRDLNTPSIEIINHFSDSFDGLSEYVSKMSKFKSARDRVIPFPDEYLNELFAEYLYTGDIKLHDETPDTNKLAVDIKHYCMRILSDRVGKVTN